MILSKYLIIAEKYNNRELSIWTCRNTAQEYIKLFDLKVKILNF